MALRVPLFDLDYDEQESTAVAAVLESRWLTMGERTASFETNFARFVETEHAVAVSSCTAGLHLGMQALGIGPGDEVICPSFTFIATANAIRYCGGRPVFADISSQADWLVSAATIEPLITERTKAIAVVHFAGFPVDMDPIIELARKHGLKVLEDAAHAPGARYKGRRVGGLGDITVFSFFSNKNLSTGEGGMLTTNDSDIADQVRRNRSHGMTTQTLDRHKGHAFAYDVIGMGFNYRMTEIEAALGQAQLDKLDRNNALRTERAADYRARLAQMPDIRLPFLDHPGESSYHIMQVLLPEGTVRKDVQAAMVANGIQTSVHYPPVHTFSTFQGFADFSHLKNTDYVGAHVLTLPLFPTMSEQQVDWVVDALADALSGQDGNAG
ncbi:MAG: DegT/DnrJ/EryC1/StrS family aminotransferase [Gammaproteobacteria bacterium]